MAPAVGIETFVDAHGCRADALRSVETLDVVFNRAIGDLGLRPLGPPVWHAFPGEGGITGVVLLAESHLTCHTFPESGFAAFNLYCCRPRARWHWEQALTALVGAREVHVRTVERGALVSVAE
jgi:S-adenosylmethionine decarboxylase